MRIQTRQYGIGGFCEACTAPEVVPEPDALIDDVHQTIAQDGRRRRTTTIHGQPIVVMTTIAMVLLVVIVIVAAHSILRPIHSGHIGRGLELLLHALIERRQLDVLAQRLVALQQKPQLYVLLVLFRVPAKGAVRLQVLAAADALLALVVLAGRVDRRVGGAQQVAAYRAGQ